MSQVVAFLGPSLPLRRLKGVTVLPPARQGDVWRALELRPRALVLVDGVFEHSPAVWHHELRDALASGVTVFGASSMGALRAAELWKLGVIGVGTIFRWYRDGELTDDGAVALLHADAEHGYRPLTVPLVNVMHLAAQLQRARVLTPAKARKLVAAARGLFYQRRTWPAVWAAFGESHEAWRREHGEDLKALDARLCLDTALEWVRAKLPRGEVSESVGSSYVRRRRLIDVHGDALARLDDEALTDAGTRTLLLSEWARSLGLVPDPREVQKWERRLQVRDPALRRRYALALALERRVLDSPEQLLSDGPSRLEGKALQAMRERRWGRGR